MTEEQQGGSMEPTEATAEATTSEPTAGAVAVADEPAMSPSLETEAMADDTAAAESAMSMDAAAAVDAEPTLDAEMIADAPLAADEADMTEPEMAEMAEPGMAEAAMDAADMAPAA